MNNPRPVPEKDFEVNLENILGNKSGSMPGPLSLMLTLTRLHFPSLISFSEVIDIIPPYSGERLLSVLSHHGLLKAKANPLVFVASEDDNKKF
jgi:hypothetical protein